MYNKRKILFSFISRNRGIVVGAFAFGFLGVLSGIMIPLFIGKFYQLTFHTHSVRGKLFDSLFSKVYDINEFFLLLFALLGLRFVFNFFEKYFSGLNGEMFARGLREQVFAKQLITRLEVYERKQTGSYLLRYSGDMAAAQNFLTKGIIAFTADCLFIVLTIIFLSSINLQLTCVVFFVFPAIFVVNKLLNNQLKKLTRKRRNTRSSNLAFVTARLNGLSTVKTFNRESVEIDKFEARSAKLYTYGKRYARLYALINALYQFMLYSMLGIILYSAHELVQSHADTIDGGTILTYIMLTISTIPVYKRILKVNIIWQAGDVSIGKIARLLNAAEEMRSLEDGAEITSGEIQITHLRFGFEGYEDIFNQLNLEIPGESITLIKGAQGVGKSTLFKLLAGLYEYTSGSIRLSGTELKQYSTQTLRKNVTLVSEQLPLLGRNIFEAVSYSRKDEKREEAKKMLDRLGFSLYGCSDVLSYPVKENGANLSAGQRKLLLIARALLTRKKIILLDEPFKDLEPVYQQKLAQMLTKLKFKRTIVIIGNETESLLIPDHIEEINSQFTHLITS